MSFNANEETPLLADIDSALIAKHEAMYTRFSPQRKRVIVALVSWAGLLPLFVSGAFMPSLPEIARELNTSGAVISLAVSLSVLAASFGALIAASYSSYYGRKAIYLVGLPTMCIGSFGVAGSTTVTQLMSWRFLQAFGSSPGLSVGAGVIGDIYRLEERGTAMGVFFAACLLGPALAPLTGGIAAQYFSWRIMQGGLGVSGILAFICILCFYPETSHPGTRGIDKWRMETGVSSTTFHITFINPFKALSLLRSPNLVAVSLAGLGVLLTDYVLLTPLAYTMAKSYNITNTALLGLCYAPIGLGNIIGAPLAGWVSDKLIIYYRKKRGGVWYPEDRLRGTLVGAGIFTPFSVLGSGILTQFVHTKVGLAFNLIFLFFNGIGVDLVLSPISAYAVDVMHERSAESMAANNALRAFLMSFAVAGILPLIDKIGVAGTNAIAAAGAWLGCLILYLTIKYGAEMRAWVDVGYSTVVTN